MKVKEVIEILGVTADKLINQLDNVGIEDADLETEIPNEVIKKFILENPLVISMKLDEVKEKVNFKLREY